MKVSLYFIISIIFLSLDPNGCEVKKIATDGQNIPQEELGILTGSKAEISSSDLAISSRTVSHPNQKEHLIGVFYMPS